MSDSSGSLKRNVPSPYEQLLHALGDSERARILVNQYAHHLATKAREGEESQWPGSIADLVDPFNHTRETWARINHCSQLANPDPQPAPDQHATVEYLVQTQQPDGTWEISSGPAKDAFWGAEKLRKLRKRIPDAEHRLAVRRTAVTIQYVAEEQQ